MPTHPLFRRLLPCVFLFFIAIIATGCGGGGGGSSSAAQGGGGGGTPVSISLAAIPMLPVVYPGTTFLVHVGATVSGSTTLPSITMQSLPAGVTPRTALPITLPSTGADIEFDVATNAAPGTYQPLIVGTLGTATAQITLSLTVASGTPPSISIGGGPFNSVATVPQGGSATYEFQVSGTAAWLNSISVSGLPTGTSATLSKTRLKSLDTFSLTITAANDAPLIQNAPFSIIASPGANWDPVITKLTLYVTGKSDVGWKNRTDYISTRSDPFGAVYDPRHELIFSSNQIWNHIDVISNATHAIVKSVPIRDPRGLDISIDGTRIWVSTGSQIMYGIDTGTLKATRYQLPKLQSPGNPAGDFWEGARVYSLADGTVMLGVTPGGGNPSLSIAIWDPVANTLTPVPAPTGDPLAAWRVVTRSGNGKHIFNVDDTSSGVYFSYDVISKTFSNPVRLLGSATSVVANPDGSRITIVDDGGFNLFDGDFNFIGSLPGDGGWGGSWIFGGSIFSPDGRTIYEETLAANSPLIVTIDTASQAITALAPAMPVTPVGVRMSPPYYVPAPFAVDSTGMLLGIQYHGIAFDDAMAQPMIDLMHSTPTLMQAMSVYGGPQTGGTISNGFRDALNLTPDVYYGSVKGSASVLSGFLQITSPAAAVSGPVNLKILFQDGIQVFNPQFFTFGTYLQDLVLSGASPGGDAPGKLDAFGLPLDPTKATVTIGVTVTTPNGTSTLPKAFFYAKSVTDYSSSDSHSYILFDGSRHKLYLSAGDHINVFSLDSNTFLSPILPAALGAKKQFQGLALTPDKKHLLAANLLDGSLAVIDADSPSNSYAINVAPDAGPFNQCAVSGPLFVAADDKGEAIVVTGSVIGTGYNCGPGGQAHVVNLAARTSQLINSPECNQNAAHVVATADGSLVAFSGSLNSFPDVFQIYSTAQQRCTGTWVKYGAAVSADGNVFASDIEFRDSSLNILGRMAMPPVLYPGRSPLYYNVTPFQNGALQNPALNDSGSLYIWAYPNSVDFVDVQHGMQRLRFSLSQTVSNTVSPMAIDSGGQNVFLITNKGLSIVDLGQALLSIGSLSQNTASAGTAIVVRGSGFEAGITMNVGSQSAVVSRIDSNTLSFTVPPTSLGLQDLTLRNPDGTTYTLENGLTIK